MSNLPPGCSVRDIPGNRPEDEATEVEYNYLCEQLESAGLIDPKNIDETWYDHLVQFMTVLRSESYSKGYQQAMADIREATEIKDTEKLAKQWRERK